MLPSCTSLLSSRQTPAWRNGRRHRLKICCPPGRTGSNPVAGTKKGELRDQLAFLLILAISDLQIGGRDSTHDTRIKFHLIENIRICTLAKNNFPWNHTMRILIRKCGFTGKYFESDTEYLSHLKELRKRFKENRAFKRKVSKLKENIHPIFQLATIDDINQWLDVNGEKIVRIMYKLYGNSRSSYRRGKRWNKEKDGIKISLTDMRYSNRIDNMHCAPIGQETNWSNPSYFAGWIGRINIELTGGGYHFFDIRFLKELGINGGTGGGGPDYLSYDVRLFADDYKKMAEIHVMERLMK